MSRLGYLLFTIVLSVILYGTVYYNGGDHRTLLYTAMFFSVPLIVANFVMALSFLILAYIRKQDEDIAHAGVTFVHAVWVSALITFTSYEFVSFGAAKLLGFFHIK